MTSELPPRPVSAADAAATLVPAPHTDEIAEFDASEVSLPALPSANWQGFVFVSFDAQTRPIESHLADLPRLVERHRPGSPRRARRIEYEVNANWKVITENYSECYHCPGVFSAPEQAHALRSRPQLHIPWSTPSS